MIIYFITVLYLSATCTARPSGEVDTQNVVTVPTNCPNGQEWVNGACRDVWKSYTAAPANVVTVPTNCPNGQEWVNGACRDVWRSFTAAPANVVTVPTNCPNGQEWVNGACRDVWKSVSAAPSNVVTVPTNCPDGQEWVNGACRDVWKSGNVAPSNVITVPTNCPNGQEWVNGACRDVWFRIVTQRKNLGLDNILDKIFAEMRESFMRSENHDQNIGTLQNSNGSDDRNVISVPNQCPNGYRPDALGVCRPIMQN